MAKKEERKSSKEQYVCFRDFRHLLAALYALPAGKGQDFITYAYESKDATAWSVPLSYFGESSQHTSILKQIFAQCQWDAEFRRDCPVDWRKRLLAEIIQGQWYRVGELDTTGSDNLWPRPSGLNPKDPMFGYILAAKDHDQADQILQALTDSLALGIEARPVVLEQSSSTASPYAFFWHVTHNVDRADVGGTEVVANVPPLSVMDAAERVWWGPVGDAPVYLEWPNDICLPESILSRLNLGQGIRIILLGPNPPERLALKMAEQLPSFHGLVDVAHLRTDNVPIQVVTSSKLSDVHDFTFEVDLKLVKRHEYRRIEDYVDDLEREIEAKRMILEKMRERLGYDDEGDADFFFEPLFLYLEKCGSIPYELQRILLEWCDQSEDLRALRYLKLDPESVPKGILDQGSLDGHEIHVLTTAMALGQGHAQGIGLQLQRYAPYRGFNPMFELMLDWAQFDVRLFVPQGRGLELYPNLPVSEVAAEKLAQALLPEARDANKQYCALLTQSDGSHVQVLQLDLSQFKPILDAFRWDCRIDVQRLEARVPRHIDDARRAFIESACKAYASPTLSKTYQTLRRVRDDISDTMVNLDKSRKRVNRCQEQLKNVDGKIDRIHQILAAIDEKRSKLHRGLSRIESKDIQIQSVFSSIEQVNLQIKQLKENIDAIRKEWTNLKK